MTQILALVAKYRKFLVAAVAAVAVILNETAGNGSLHWVDVVAAITGALAVAAVPNAAPAAAPVVAVVKP
jgi:nicotinamide riboside transporter PnuC